LIQMAYTDYANNSHVYKFEGIVSSTLKVFRVILSSQKNQKY